MVAPVPRPGQTYFVPGVRVMRLGPLTPSPEPGVEITEIKPDILGVEVTRVNHGSGQYCITVNNWFDALPRDRSATPPLGGGREIIGATGNPLWPRFKYNDFKVLDFGMRLRIDMRYWPEPEPALEVAAPDDARAQRWVPMIAGPITDMRFSFGADGAKLTVCGEDDLCCLKNKNPQKVDYWARPEKEIIDDVIRRSGCPLALAPPRTPLPSFTESEGKALAEAHFEGQSYLDYLMHFAERMDCEVFVEFRSLDDPGSGIELHFERSRSRTPPDRTLREVYVLERGKNLVDFNPDLKVVDQWTSVTLTGRDHHQNSPNTISATVPPPDVLDDELHRDAARGDPPLVSGPEWRRRKFGPNPHHEYNQRGLDQERAQVMADAVYRRRAREFLKIHVTTIGLPRLRAGWHVEIRGLRPPFDGFYYVEHSVHTFGPGGLVTTFTARRPGMPYPPYGEA
jgi:hypothetical protein